MNRDISLKKINLTLIFGAVVIAVTLGLIIRDNNKSEDQPEAAKQACIELAPHYGEQYQVVDGFYKDLIVVALEARPESVNVKIYSDPEHETYRFKCNELKRL